MSNGKKVQQDIDRLIRRTQDGIEVYDAMYDKFTRAATQVQKERLEGDLKKEIKKLQRFRDAIKVLIATPDVKDTSELEKFQKVIEGKMEDFKVCERETKTKAFSKEGLAASSPNEAPQAHTESWLKSAMDDARKQIEIIEYDVEKSSRHHGRGKNASPQLSADAERLRRLKYHLLKLEQLLKMVTNGYTELQEVDKIADSVQDFLRNEDDGDEEAEMALYAQFDLPDVETHPSRRATATDDEDGDAQTATDGGPKRSSAASPASAKAAHAKTPPSTTSAGKSDAAKRTAHTWEEGALLDDEMDAANADTFGDDAMDMAGVGSLAEMAKFTASLPRMGDWEKGRPATLALPAGGKPKPGAEPVAQRAEHTPKTAAHNSPTAAHQTAATGAPNASAAAAAAAAVSFREDKSAMLNLVNMSLACLPHTQDVDRQRPFEPSNPTKCPPYYPQQVLPVFSTQDIYRDFELETLFFIFYYHQNTYQQYCAAKQIKASSYRYHTQLNQWFQRVGNLIEVKSDSEKGSFMYFDYEDEWRMEEKENFTFDYKYLEDELR